MYRRNTANALSSGVWGKAPNADALWCLILTLFFALKTDIVDFSADKILGGNFQILGENFPPEMPRINTAFWTLKSGGDRLPHSKKWGGGPVPPRPPGNYAYDYDI
jgi:hypothetical protein